MSPKEWALIGTKEISIAQTVLVKSNEALTDSLILLKIFGRELKKSGMPGRCKDCKGFYVNVPSDSNQFSPRNWKLLGKKDTIPYHVEHIQDIEEKGIKKTMVILSGQGIDCHPCPGVCGAAIFVKEGEEWKLETWENDVAVFGSSGNAVDEIEVYDIGNSTYAIILKNGGIWQSISWRFFTVLLYSGGAFKEVLEEPVTFSSSNWTIAEHESPFTPYAYTATIRFLPSRTECGDMVVHYHGTFLNERGTPKFLNKAIHFKYKGGKYIPTEKIPGES